MYSLQKLLPTNKIRPGAFSIHSKANQSVELNRSQEQKVTRSVDVNQQSLVQLQTQMQLLNKKQPTLKSDATLKVEQQQLIGILEAGKRKETPKPQKDNRRLNFNVTAQQEDQQVINTSNQMANMIIENILNKDEYYEKVRIENQELKERFNGYQLQLAENKKKITHLESTLKEAQGSLITERNRYQTELLKINEKIQQMKNDQRLQMEQKKNELLTSKLQEQLNSNQHLKTFVAENCVSCIDYLNFLKKIISSFQPDMHLAYNSLISLFKQSLQIVFDSINKTQQLNLPALKSCILPDEFDVNGFIAQLEQLSEQSELSFRDKKPTPKIKLQEQFNSFLDESMPAHDLELGSPYFTSHDPVKFQDKFKQQMTKEQKRDQMPLQVNKQQRKSPVPIVNDQVKRKQEPLQNFHTFNNHVHQISSVQEIMSENDTLVYDSLMKELQNPKREQRSSSVHTLKYLDQQIQKEQEKINKRNKENLQVNTQTVIAKYDYKAQKDVDLSFKKGDRIKLVKKTTNGWWFGELDGTTGYFPHNFVQLLDS